MSDAIGPIAVMRDSEQLLPSEISPDTQKLVDDEVRAIVERAHGDASTLLAANRDRLDALAHALLEHETLDESDGVGDELPAVAAA